MSPSPESSVLEEGALVAKTKIHLEPADTASGEGAGYYGPGDRLPDDLLPETVAEFTTYDSAQHGIPYVNEGPTITPEDMARIGHLIGLKVKIRLDKYDGGEGVADARAADPDIAPDDVVEIEDNLLTIGGASLICECLMGNGTATANQALTYLNAANAHLGVGDSSTAAADTQTDLQASSNKLRKGMDATYPQHTDSTSTAGAKTITLRATFGTSEANFAWAEWGSFTGTTGRMVSRKVESLGTKTSASSWVLTVTLAWA